jgi:hypothetical protein
MLATQGSHDECRLNNDADCSTERIAGPSTTGGWVATLREAQQDAIWPVFAIHDHYNARRGEIQRI